MPFINWLIVIMAIMDYLQDCQKSGRPVRLWVFLVFCPLILCFPIPMLIIGIVCKSFIMIDEFI
jgi:hypothetical protein